MIYYRNLYRGKSKKTNCLTLNNNVMSEEVQKTTNWVAIVTIISNAIVELIKLIFG